MCAGEPPVRKEANAVAQVPVSLARMRAPGARLSPQVALGATRPAAGQVIPAMQGRQEEGSGVCAAGPKLPAGHGVGAGEPAGQ